MKRYVMGTRPDGTSDILIEDTYDVLPEIIPGRASAKDIWVSAETPAEVTGTGDTVSDALVHEPPHTGSIFRVLKVEPGDQVEGSVDDLLAMHNRLASDAVPDREYLEHAKHASMHRTNTLNYMVLVSGQLTALTENRDVVLLPGDLLVQKACMHGWRNDGGVPAVLVAAMIDAER